MALCELSDFEQKLHGLIILSGLWLYYILSGLLDIVIFLHKTDALVLVIMICSHLWTPAYPCTSGYLLTASAEI